MNRYSDYSVSAYNPLSLEEIAMVPAMKRKQHEDVLAKQELVRSGLAKVDPLDVHFNEALKLKQGLEGKMDQTALELSQNGINNDMIGKTIALNREFQDLTSPTGRIGQINAAKIAEAQAYKKFLESDDAKSNSQEVNLANWKKFRSQYTGYDDKGNISNIGDLGAVKYIDPNKFVDDLATHAGFTSENKSDAFASLVDNGNANGTRYTVNTQEAHKRGSNLKQLQSLADLMNNLQNDTTSPLRKSIDYTGRNMDEVSKQIASQLGIYRKNETEDSTEFNYSNVDYAKSDTDNSKLMFNDAIQDPSSIQNLDKDIHDVDFSKIGVSKFEGSLAGTNTYNLSQKDLGEKHSKIGGNANTYKSVLNPLQQRFYEVAAKKLIKNGKLPKNADLNNTKNASIIGFYMKNHMKFPTVSNDIIRADVAIDNKLFSGNLASKDQNSRNATLEQDLRGDNSLRTMVDVKTGQKIKLEEGDKVDYLGVDSPINYRNYNFGNNRAQSVMAHRAHILDKDGNIKANVAISRSSNEMNDQNFKNMYDINQIYKNCIERLGEWQKPKGKFSGNTKLKSISIKINDDNTIQIKRDNSQYPSRPLNNEEFLLQMDRIMNE